MWVFLKINLTSTPTQQSVVDWIGPIYMRVCVYTYDMIQCILQFLAGMLSCAFHKSCEFQG